MSGLKAIATALSIHDVSAVGLLAGNIPWHKNPYFYDVNDGYGVWEEQEEEETTANAESSYPASDKERSLAEIAREVATVAKYSDGEFDFKHTSEVQDSETKVQDPKRLAESDGDPDTGTHRNPAGDYQDKEVTTGRKMSPLFPQDLHPLPSFIDVEDRQLYNASQHAKKTESNLNSSADTKEMPEPLQAGVATESDEENQAAKFIIEKLSTPPTSDEEDLGTASGESSPSRRVEFPRIDTHGTSGGSHMSDDDADLFDSATMTGIPELRAGFLYRKQTGAETNGSLSFESDDFDTEKIRSDPKAPSNVPIFRMSESKWSAFEEIPEGGFKSAKILDIPETLMGLPFYRKQWKIESKDSNERKRTVERRFSDFEKLREELSKIQDIPPSKIQDIPTLPQMPKKGNGMTRLSERLLQERKTGLQAILDFARQHQKDEGVLPLLTSFLTGESSSHFQSWKTLNEATRERMHLTRKFLSSNNLSL